VASVRGHSSIAVGNVVGSNIFNVLFVLGGTGLIRPLEASLDAARIDVAVMLGFTLLASLLLTLRERIGRSDGAILLVCYPAFLALRSVGTLR
jgi:cation:H+ antiporter